MHEREKNDFSEDLAQHLMFRGLVTCELFSLKDYADLMKGLEALFRELRGRSPLLEHWQTRCQEFIQKGTRSLSSGGFHKFLSITSDKSMTSRVPNCIFFETLPDSISLLSLSLINILPSLMGLVSLCEFDDSISNGLRRIMNRGYEEERTRMGDSEAWEVRSPDQRRKDEVRQYIFGVRRSVEEFISRYFHGVFLSDESRSRPPGCPGIELFSLDKLPLDNGKDIEDWTKKKDNRFFLDEVDPKIWTVH